MNIKTLCALSLILAINGCASIIEGKSQTMALTTSDDIDKKNTECELRNSKGAWNADSKDSLVIFRDYDDLIINCENEQQEGELVVESSANVGFMVLNFIIWDFCTVSCLVDHTTGALYEYPSNIIVPMRAKEQAQDLNAQAPSDMAAADNKDVEVAVESENGGEAESDSETAATPAETE